jgi:uncharacterized protein YdhG (YjbR/CyaY superfamily)
MKKRSGKKDVAAYIAAAPAKVRPMLRQLRSAIRASAPRAEEKISYGIPYYGYHGRLIYFAAFKHHVSLYVMGRARRKFAKALQPYQTSKATCQFPIGCAIPVALVTKLVRDRVKENEASVGATARK